jgi:hypothetical protein
MFGIEKLKRSFRAAVSHRKCWRTLQMFEMYDQQSDRKAVEFFGGFFLTWRSLTWLRKLQQISVRSLLFLQNWIWKFVLLKN